MNDKFIKYLNKWYFDQIEVRSRHYYFQIHLTKKCQNACQHCYFRELGKSDEDINFSFLEKSIRKIKDNADKLTLTPRIDFTGGDPFLYPQFMDAIRLCDNLHIPYGIKCNPDFFIQNGSNEALQEIENCKEIILSIDGLESTHDLIRGDHSFKNTLAAASKIKEADRYLHFHYTVSKYNWKELIPTIDFLIKEHFIVDDFTWGLFWGSEKNTILQENELIQLYDQYTDFFNIALEDSKFYYISKDGRMLPRVMLGFMDSCFFPYFFKKGVVSDIVIRTAKSHPGALGCMINRNAYILDTDGRVYRCRKLPETFGDYLWGSSDKTSSYKKKYSSDCKSCIFNPFCNGCEALSKVSCQNSCYNGEHCFFSIDKE